MKRYKGLTSHLVFAIAAGAFGSSFQHGYNTGVTNIPQLLIQKFINDTYYERYQEEAGDNTVTFIFSILVSIFCVGGMAGALLTAFVAERFGRKGGLLLNNVFVILAAIFMGSSKAANSYEMLIIGRFFIGFNSGLNAGLAPMYLAEISPLHLRGAVGTIYQLVITISILVSQVLGLPQILGTEDRWPFLFAMTLVPSIFMLVTLPFCPESPKYILITQGRDVSAQKALTWLRGTIEVHDEMDEMRAEYEAMKLVPKVTLHEMWHNPVLRTPLFISVMVMLSQQLSGINAAIFFSTDIFLSAGLSDADALNATLGMGSINVVMTIVSLFLVEQAGRRTLHLCGLGGMMTMTILLTICLACQKSAPWLSYVSIICVITFVVMFAIGPVIFASSECFRCVYVFPVYDSVGSVLVIHIQMCTGNQEQNSRRNNSHLPTESLSVSENTCKERMWNRTFVQQNYVFTICFNNLKQIEKEQLITLVYHIDWEIYKCLLLPAMTYR
ncbi:solute carrier family 2, facilitated glucose transporter member 5 [Nephila pilipes]|uniref:Solute carrier family 2, facilitated glucose transporter member 5 n=1 Tax=Nephila pilipes TaxID=299642 RepID=A0A8X6UKG9_NEPPI|nr:solute carrier family 2, facilitated glucose transporter member 5 [Nephila pilipes]